MRQRPDETDGIGQHHFTHPANLTFLTVGSRVANNWSATKLPAPVNALNNVDLPAFV